MLSNYLSSIEGVAIYPIISLVIFFGIFVSMLVWVFRIDKNYIATMQNLPLDNNRELETNNGLKNGK